tara:strand:- start:592 stop:1221 length:630 start_codon:yes stop_codon:yes gene_type:complete
MSFDKLLKLNVNDKTEKKKTGNTTLTYLSWSYAWQEFVKVYPEATYEIIKDEGKPYFSDKSGAMCYTKVTANNLTHEMWLPVMNGANKAMKAEPYIYKTKFGDKEVEAYTMFDINKTLMRCLVKNLAMFGLGLYIYAGEDLPGAEPIKLINQEQVLEIVKLLAEASTTLEPLMKKLNWGIVRLEDIQEINFQYVVDLLNDKIKRQAEDK